MKKSLLVLLLALALVTPVFATDKGDMEIVGKLGLNLNPKVEASGSFVDVGAFNPYFTGDSDVNMSVLIGAEFFYYLNKNVALGVGINNNFNADLKDMKDYGLDYKGEVGFTNFYFAVKPKIELESKVFNSVYFLGQIGYGLFRFDGHEYGEADGNGLYWGIGAGTEIYKNFIVELLYSFNYGSIKLKEEFGGDETADLTYKIFTLNIGYKFSL